MSAKEPLGVQEPPRTIGGILRKIGPGLVLAGTLVGSGELIAATRTGAEAGFSLLWLIILGCVIKVFVQVELGRHTISTGKTALEALNGVPGPVFSFSLTRGGRRFGANWIVWCWIAMFVANIFLFSGIIGGLGQSLAITVPLTEQGRAYNEYSNLRVDLQVKKTQREKLRDPAILKKLDDQILIGDATIKKMGPRTASHDDKYWAASITVVTVILLLIGRYNFIEVFALVMVSSFTIVTIVNLFILQGHPSWAIHPGEIINGLTFSLPEAVGDKAPLMTALATFGIIGVGAADQVLYPYWCQEKGYSKWTGPHSGSAAWKGRARGWMRVLQWDAWASCVLYTFTTIAFYLLGAAILGRIGLVPEGSGMIRTLSVMYVPVFGEWAQWLFLFGAFAVLFSTFFIGSAGHCRTGSDVMVVMKMIDGDEPTRQRWIRNFAFFFPIAATLVSFTVGNPVVLILIGGVAQAILLPMIALGALYFRYKESDPSLAPGRLWDILLWICLAVFIVIGLFLAYDKIA